MRYIYGLTEPDWGELRYVGVANNAKKRFWQHLNTRTSKTHVSRWIQSLLRDGKKPEMFIIEEVEDWKEAEHFWINYFRAIGSDLTNLCDGGGGMSNPLPLVRKKMSDARKGDKHPLYGKHHSAETRLKISSANRGKKIKPFSEIHKTRIANWHTGKPLSEETKKRISDAKKGSVVTQEQRDKLSKALKGRVFTEEHRRKLSLSQIGNTKGVGKRPSQQECEQRRQRALAYWKQVKETKYQPGTDRLQKLKENAKKGRLGNKSRTGQHNSPESIEKARQKHIGTHHSEETKAKMSASAKLWRKNRREEKRKAQMELPL